jgi:hypothetical protein
MTSLRGRKNLVALAPALLGLALLMLSMGGDMQTITGSEAQQIFGGDNGTACNVGSQLDGGKDCLGMCANNPTYAAVGANGTRLTTPSCGTCGGNYKGSAACP